jgi:hypothetical protein
MVSEGAGVRAGAKRRASHLQFATLLDVALHRPRPDAAEIRRGVRHRGLRVSRSAPSRGAEDRGPWLEAGARPNTGAGTTLGWLRGGGLVSLPQIGEKATKGES